MKVAFAVLITAAIAAPGLAETDRVSVAYAALTNGQNAAAIEQLTVTNSADAARLINLGTAYARTGNMVRAAAMYRAAAESPRYDLELANGSSMDSRALARIALARLSAKMDTRYAAK